jgi:exonuclease VII small subunit
MNDLEKRLIELKMAIAQYRAGVMSKQKQDEFLDNAKNIVSSVLNSPGNDTVVINHEDNSCNTTCVGYTGSQGYTGSVGYTGSQGPKGDPGECNTFCSAILVSNDYTATCNDYYIGVNSNNAVTITLPPECNTCCEIVVKAEMGPPIGNRKVTITTSDGSFIDGSNSYVMTIPYESVQLICRGGDWHII